MRRPDHQLNLPLLAVAALALTVGAGIGLASCNSVPVSNLSKSFSQVVQQSSGTDQPIKIDFLWMVDDSTSMADEQRELANNFSVFTDKLKGLFQLDPRVAVVPTDMQCDPSSFLSKGHFNTTPYTGLSVALERNVIKPCVQDSDCGDNYVCDFNYPNNISCLRNPNDSPFHQSVNSKCRRTCSTDQECKDAFGPDYQCLMPGQESSGCVLPPATKGCPDTLPPVLSGKNLDLFPCMATVGLNQNNCYKYEQGLRSVFTALQADGPNKASLDCTDAQEKQGKCTRFLRPDAYLVIVFVSDEDDCSAPDGSIAFENYNTCTTLPDQYHGGPLIPVSQYVNLFKSLKNDPSKVIVAAIGGDAKLPEPPPDLSKLSCEDCTKWNSIVCPDDPANPIGSDCKPPVVHDFCQDANYGPGSCKLTCDASPEVQHQRFQNEAEQSYFCAKSDPHTCYNTSHICESSNGAADWGRRYQELTQAFGPNGLFTNICGAQGIGAALDQIAKQIIAVVNKLCLPQPVLDPSKLVVTRTRTDPNTGALTTETLKRYDQPNNIPSGMYYIEAAGGEDCKDPNSGQERPALIFGDPPTPGERITATYQGNPLTP